MNNLDNLDIATTLFSQQPTGILNSLLDDPEHVLPIPEIISRMQAMNITNDVTAEDFHDLCEDLYSSYVAANNAAAGLCDAIDLSQEEKLKYYETTREILSDVLFLWGPGAKMRAVREFLDETQDFLIGFNEASPRQLDIHIAKLARLARRMRD
jgi:hypothetical protein